MAGTQESASSGRHAVLVGSGIFLSRIAGLVRQSVFAHYFGSSAAADAFQAAFRIPNFLQNMLGEGVLSASFIPVYAKLLARREDEEASRVASAVGTLLALAVSGLVLAGVLGTPLLIDIIAPGFEDATRALAIRLVRILFPGTGLLVMSAWCLGILNSHHRFFLSYTAPVGWNLVMIATLLVLGGRVAQFPLAVALAWGSVAGSALQLLIQLPTVMALEQRLRPALHLASTHVREVVRNFLPVFTSRGVVQISSYVDTLLASLLPTGAVAAMGYATTINLLPVSLFGMAVSAAALPAMSRELGSPDEVAAALRQKLDAGLRRIAFLCIPSAMAFLALGDVLAGTLFQSGRFGRADAVYVWAILAGSGLGILASTMGRLYSSTYYALKDTRTPLRYACLHVALATGLGYLCALPLPVALHIDPRWGVAGLTASASMAAFVELAFLRRTLGHRIGRTGIPPSLLGKLWLSAVPAAAIAWAIKLGIGLARPRVAGIAILVPYGLVYVGAALAMRLPEAREIMDAVLRQLFRKAPSAR